MLDLDDPKWSVYRTRNGVGRDLVHLLDPFPASDEDYYRIFHECCDLETFDVYPAAFAMVPHLEQIAADSETVYGAQWPLHIIAAICANFKTSKTQDDVPAELWENFDSSVMLAQETVSELITKHLKSDPSMMKTMMIVPVLNLNARSIFSNPVPNSFILFDWFEERRPEHFDSKT